VYSVRDVLFGVVIGWVGFSGCAVPDRKPVTGLTEQYLPAELPLIADSRTVSVEMANGAWVPHAFSSVSSPTRYWWFSGRYGTEIHAQAQAGASALRTTLAVDPQRFSALAWSWWVRNALPGTDLTLRTRDDCAARVMITYRFDSTQATLFERLRHRTLSLRANQELPYRILCYVWAGADTPARILRSPAARDIAIITLRSGNTEAGRWIEERVDHRRDYQTAFASEPPPIMGLVLMTDSDDTGASARAAYRELRFIETP
jgi:hypothetical protein